MYKQLDQAIAFAAVAHAGQLRKYDGLPYIVHPLQVMTILHQTAAVVSEDQLVAAVLHDVVEDTAVSIETIRRRFGLTVADLVWELTDQFADPALGNRKRRKAAERERLASISPQAQDIKLADLIDNTRSIVRGDPGFARVYLQEKAELLEVMTAGDERLQRVAQDMLRGGQQMLVQFALEKKDVSATAPSGARRQPDDGAAVPGLAGLASITR